MSFVSSLPFINSCVVLYSNSVFIEVIPYQIGLSTVLSVPDCFSLFNIKESMFPSTFHPDNAAGRSLTCPYSLKVYGTYSCWMTTISIAFPSRWLLTEHSPPPPPPCCALRIPFLSLVSCFLSCLENKVITFFTKLNLKLSPS